LSNRNKWEEDLELDRKMQPVIDSHFKQFFDISQIIRFTQKENTPHPLDQYFGIDGEIILKCGSIITFQTKVRRQKYLKRFGDYFTIEYFSNNLTKTEGEFFHLASDIYFYGYLNKEETDFEKYHILKVFPLKNFIATNFIKYIQNLRYNKKHSFASFIPIPFSEIPSQIFIEGN